MIPPKKRNVCVTREPSRGCQYSAGVDIWLRDSGSKLRADALSFWDLGLRFRLTHRARLGSVEESDEFGQLEHRLAPLVSRGPQRPVPVPRHRIPNGVAHSIFTTAGCFADSAVLRGR